MAKVGTKHLKVGKHFNSKKNPDLIRKIVEMDQDFVHWEHLENKSSNGQCGYSTFVQWAKEEVPQDKIDEILGTL